MELRFIYQTVCSQELSIEGLDRAVVQPGQLLSGSTSAVGGIFFEKLVNWGYGWWQKILHHLGYQKKGLDIGIQTNIWGILSGAGFFPSTVFLDISRFGEVVGNVSPIFLGRYLCGFLGQVFSAENQTNCSWVVRVFAWEGGCST